jgi:3-oxoacyl-[acyl-carrier protein] reductase
VIPIDLAGRNAIVTGGTRGIGRAIAVLTAKAGANVTTLAKSRYESLLR